MIAMDRRQFLVFGTALGAGLVADKPAPAANMRIAMVVKALGIGFFDAAPRAARRRPRSWATSS
jgi:hypothetical protein